MPVYDTALTDAPKFRGERNNNPTNLDRGNPRIGWRGEDTDQSGDSRFSVFSTVEFGIRAAIVNMRTHSKRDRDGKFHVSELVSIWAPPNENNTVKYIQFVAQRLQAATPGAGMPADPLVDVFNRGQMLVLLKAIITKECGRNIYPDQVILRGIEMAGGWR